MRSPFISLSHLQYLRNQYRIKTSLRDLCLKHCSIHYPEIKDQLHLLPASLKDEIKKLRYKENLKTFRQFRSNYLGQCFDQRMMNSGTLSTIEMELNYPFDYYINHKKCISHKGQKIIIHINGKNFLYNMDYFKFCYNDCECCGENCRTVNKDIKTYRQLIALIDDLNAISQYKLKEGRSVYVLDLAPFKNLDRYNMFLR